MGLKNIPAIEALGPIESKWLQELRDPVEQFNALFILCNEVNLLLTYIVDIYIYIYIKYI